MTSNFHILMYSHDTYGLGHIRRTLAIAGYLNQPGTNILIITGSPITSRFSFPMGIDYVRLPGMIKTEDGEYQPSAIRLDASQVMNIRKQLILSTIMTFKPNLFIVDKEPLGLKNEVVPGLEWIRKNLQGTKTVVGLRDIMDEKTVVNAHWQKKNVFSAMKKFYSEIWVYGQSDLYDSIREYNIPEDIRPKLFFTGYIPRLPADPETTLAVRKQYRQKDLPLILVTTGGGKDGYDLLVAFLSWCETQDVNSRSFESLLIFGPFLTDSKKTRLEKKARRLQVRTLDFSHHMDALVGAADLIVCMGGYNTLCEALSNKKTALVIPREHPRKEQLIRAQVMQKKGLLDYIPWAHLSPERLGKKIRHMLDHRAGYEKAIAGFKMNGAETILARVNKFRKGLS